MHLSALKGGEEKFMVILLCRGLERADKGVISFGKPQVAFPVSNLFLKICLNHIVSYSHYLFGAC